MKLYLVGQYNKPDKLPLCSSTKSGKVIDEIIKRLSSDLLVIHKTNLCNCDEQPPEEEIYTHACDWFDNYHPENAIVVLLGSWVQQNFLKEEVKVHGNSIVEISHPAAHFYSAKVRREEYITKAAFAINKELILRISNHNH